jgi:alanine dehydrogenase
MKAEEVLLLTAQDARTLLTVDECIAAVEGAFRAHGEGQAPPPGVLSVQVARGGFHIKAGMLHLGRHYFAAKVNANLAENGARFGLPTIQGVIVLCDAEKGYPLAVMDSREITALRTAAASAVAAKYLARSDSHTLTVCGCGEQGGAQVKALARVCRLQRVFAFDKNRGQAQRLARELEDNLNIPVTPADDLAGATVESDVCITCTPSHEALLGPEDVRPGTFIAAVGADSPIKQELHPALLANSKIVVDVLEQCAVMGDLHHALDAGIVTRSDVHAELGEVVARKKPGRVSSEEIIVFDSTGMALQDVAAAAALYEKAERGHCGLRYNLAA